MEAAVKDAKQGLDTLTKIQEQFSQGAYDGKAPRQLQALVREWKAVVSVPTTTALAKGDAEDQLLGQQLKAAEQAVLQIGNFLRTFLNVSKTSSAKLMEVWLEVSTIALPSSAKGLVLARKSMEELLTHEQPDKSAFELLDVGDRPGGRQGCKLVRDAQQRAEICSALFSMVVASIFSIACDKKEPDTVRKAKDTVAKTISDLAALGLTLAPPEQEMLEHLVVLSNPSQSDPEKIGKAVQSFQTGESCLKKAAKTRIGAVLVAEATDLQKTLAESALAGTEIQNLATKVKDWLPLVADYGPQLMKDDNHEVKFATHKAACAEAAGLVKKIQGSPTGLTLHQPDLKFIVTSIADWLEMVMLVVLHECAGVVQFIEGEKRCKMDAGIVGRGLAVLRAVSVMAADLSKITEPLGGNDNPHDNVELLIGVIDLAFKRSEGQRVGGSFASLPVQSRIAFGLELGVTRAAGHLDQVAPLGEAFHEMWNQAYADMPYKIGGFLTDVVKTIENSITEVLSHFEKSIDGEAAKKTLTVSATDINFAISSSGELTPDIVRKPSDLDVSKHLPEYDHLHGALRVVKNLGSESNAISALEAEVGLCTTALPILSAMIAHDKLPSTGSDDAQRKFLQSFASICNEIQMADGKFQNEIHKTFRQGLKAWLDATRTRCQEALAATEASVRGKLDEMEPLLVDVKEMFKSKVLEDATVDSFLELPGRVELRDGVKWLNEPCGLQRLATWASMLKDSGIDLASAEETQKNGKGVRSRARVQVAVRSGCSILKNKSVEKLDGFWAQVTNSKAP